MSQVADITGKLNAKTPKGDEISAETAAKLSLAAAELGGRSQLVLLTRDMLYSICELSAQGLIDKDKASSLFQQVGEVAVKLGQSQVAREQRLAVEAAKVDAAAQAMFDEYRATESRAIVAIMVNLSESGVFSTARLEKMKSILQTDDFRDLAPLRSDIAAISSQDDLKTKLTLDFQDYLDDFLRASQLAATAKS
ncbi:MAG TPA: hypothetical protein VNH64_07310 [Parvularculaceae bacterium]|nr:hypothetical protein [Parvularculaceae bacterium]